MIHRKLSTLRNTMLFNVDDTGNATPPPDTSQAKTEDKGASEKLFTQAEVNSLTAKEKRDGKTAAEKAILGMFNVNSVDELKAKLEAKSEADKNEQSETKRLSDELNSIKQSLEAEKQARADERKASLNHKRDGELEKLLTQAQANDPNEVLALLKVFHADKVEALLDEQGNFKKAEAESLIAAYRKDKGHLFKDNRLGSAMSNRDGIAPEPNKELKQAAQKRSFQNARNGV